MNSPRRPSKVRYLIISAATLMAFLLYLDRFCVSFAVDYIRQDLGLTQNQISWFLSAFFWSYALAQVPSGWLSDRYGGRIMLVIYILTWSVFTALIGASTSFAMLMLTRLGCGLGQAGAYPTAASVVARWVPMTSRGLASAMVANGGRIGGAAAPLLTAYLIVLCIPAGTPWEFQSDDLLMPAELAEQLADGGPEDYLQSNLSSDAQAALRRLAANPEAVAETDSADHAALLAIVNELIDAGDLYDAEQMKSINLPREMLALLKRQTAGETLATEEQLKLNRFILEGVFPRALAKYYRHGWRPILYIYGAAGILVAGFFWFSFRERPDLHPWSNQEEHELVMKGREETARHHDKQLGAAPVRQLATSLNMWYCCIMQWGTNIGWLFIMTWLPRYLMDVHQVPIVQRGYMTMLPAMIGILGMFLGGRMTDVLALHYGVKWGRRLPISLSRVTAVLAYVACIAIGNLWSESWLNQPWVFTGLFCMVAFSTDFGAAPTWAFNQDIGGRHVGSVLGWGNMWGNLGAACAPPIYDHFLGENPTLTEWNTMFAVCALSFTLSGICSLLIDSSVPIVREEDES